jgi:hypothetical protein
MVPEMLTGVPSGTSAVLDMTAEFVPLLIGLYGLLVVSIGGLILSSLYPLTSRTAQPMGTRAVRTAPAPDMSEAA